MNKKRGPKSRSENAGSPVDSCHEKVAMARPAETQEKYRLLEFDGDPGSFRRTYCAASRIQPGSCQLTVLMVDIVPGRLRC